MTAGLPVFTSVGRHNDGRTGPSPETTEAPVAPVAPDEVASSGESLGTGFGWASSARVSLGAASGATTTPVSSSNASAIRWSRVSPPCPPDVDARSGCSTRHRASTIAASRAFNVAPSNGGNKPDRPIIPPGTLKNRSNLRARCFAATSSPYSPANRKSSAAAISSSGDLDPAPSSNPAAPGNDATGAIAATCSAEIAPEANSSNARGTFRATFATSRRRFASRPDTPHDRASAAAESRVSGIAPTRTAVAASTSRRNRSNSRTPHVSSCNVHSCGTTVGTRKAVHGAAPRASPCASPEQCPVALSLE